MLFDFWLSQGPIVEPLVREAALKYDGSAQGRGREDKFSVREVVAESFGGIHGRT